MKNIFKILSLVTVLSLVGVSSSCNDLPVDPPVDPCLDGGDDCPVPPEPYKGSIVEKIVFPEEAEVYSEAKLFANDIEIPLLKVMTNSSHVFVPPTAATPAPQRDENAYTIIRLKGLATFEIRTNYEININTRVLPSSYGIKPSHDLNAKTIKFEIFNPGQYTIEPNNDPTKTIHLFVDEYIEDQVLPVDITDPNVIYFGPGYYSKANDSRINGNDRLQIRSNQTVYIDYGAQVNAILYANNATNIKVLGGGVLSGAILSRLDQRVPINFEHCRNIEIDGISIIDPAAWTLNLYFCEDALINNIKIISSRANGDGITLQSCQRIVSQNSFVRGFDDNLVVKNYTSPYGNRPEATKGRSDDILFKNMLLWTDLAQSMEIGYETVANDMTNIRFENITVLHAFHKAAISIHNGNDALIHDITFKDITIEVASMGLGDSDVSAFIEFTATYSQAFSAGPSREPLPIGNIEGVNVKNVLVKQQEGGNKGIVLRGQKDDRALFDGNISYVRDVTLEDIKVVNTPVLSNSRIIVKNEYVQNLVVRQSGDPVIGATISLRYTIDELRAFGSEVKVITYGE